jgi:hypothetical protein
MVMVMSVVVMIVSVVPAMVPHTGKRRYSQHHQ